MRREFILDEKKYIEHLLEEKTLGNKAMTTLTLAARLWTEQGYGKDEIRSMLEDLILRNDPTASIIKWDGAITIALKNREKKLVQIDGVPITKLELDMCRRIKDRQKQRLLFTLFCIAKFEHMVNPKSQGWTNVPTSKLFSMANINTSVRRQAYMINDLLNDNYIQTAKKIDSTAIRVTFMDLESPPEASITDFRNLGNQFKMINGEKYFKCECCGLVVKRKTNNQKFCKECGRQVNIMKTVASRARRRQGNKEQPA